MTGTGLYRTRGKRKNTNDSFRKYLNNFQNFVVQLDRMQSSAALLYTIMYRHGQIYRRYVFGVVLLWGVNSAESELDWLLSIIFQKVTKLVSTKSRVCEIEHYNVPFVVFFYWSGIEYYLKFHNFKITCAVKTKSSLIFECITLTEHKVSCNPNRMK